MMQIIDCNKLQHGQVFKFVLDGASCGDHKLPSRSGEFISVGIRNNYFHHKIPEFESEDWTCMIPIFDDISDDLNARIFEFLDGSGDGILPKELARKIIQRKMIKIGNRFYRKSSINVEIHYESKN